MAGNVAKEFLSFPAYQGPGIEGYFLDFLGAKTNCAYLPSEVSWLSGKVFGYPTKGDSILFDVEEWIGVLRSVIEAKNSLTVLELGAGWGPWIVSAMSPARNSASSRWC